MNAKAQGKNNRKNRNSNHPGPRRISSRPPQHPPGPAQVVPRCPIQRLRRQPFDAKRNRAGQRQPNPRGNDVNRKSLRHVDRRVPGIPSCIVEPPRHPQRRPHLPLPLRRQDQDPHPLSPLPRKRRRVLRSHSPTGRRSKKRRPLRRHQRISNGREGKSKSHLRRRFRRPQRARFSKLPCRPTPLHPQLGPRRSSGLPGRHLSAELNPSPAKSSVTLPSAGSPHGSCKNPSR